MPRLCRRLKERGHVPEHPRENGSKHRRRGPTFDFISFCLVGRMGKQERLCGKIDVAVSACEAAAAARGSHKVV